MKIAVKQKILLAVSAVLAAGLLCACGGQSQSGQAQSGAGSRVTPSKPQGGATESYQVVNHTYTVLSELYIAPSSDGDWGSNLLGTKGLAHEGTLGYKTSADSVDVRYVDENDLAHEVYGVALAPGAEISLTVGQVAYGVYVTYTDGSGEYYAETGAPDPDPTPHDDGPVVFELVNGTPYEDDSMVAVYVAPHPQGGGPDILESTVLWQNDTLTVSLESVGGYDFSVLDGAGATWYFEDVLVDNETQVIFYRGTQHELILDVFFYNEGSTVTYYAVGMSA